MYLVPNPDGSDTKNIKKELKQSLVCGKMLDWIWVKFFFKSVIL